MENQTVSGVMFENGKEAKLYYTEQSWSNRFAITPHVRALAWFVDTTTAVQILEWQGDTTNYVFALHGFCFI